MKIFKVLHDGNLKDFTDNTYPQGSFALSALLRKRDIKVNGVRTGKNIPLKAGDEVVYYTTPAQENKPSHAAVYEDEDIYVADKHSGVSCEGLLSELCGKGEFYAVHRLDRNTMGLIVFAKNKAAEDRLLCAFKEREVKKTYVALCKNAFKKQGGVLTDYLVKDSENSFVKVYHTPDCGGAKIVTEYEVKENCGDIAFVEITLHTGKTHQIRAHMAYMGCPVLGDEKYGDRALNAKYNAKRQCLIADRLTIDGKTFKSNLTF